MTLKKGRCKLYRVNVHNAIFQIEILNQFIEYFFLKSNFEIEMYSLTVPSDLSLENKLQLKNVIKF